jgi:phosphate-selective porin
MMSLSGKYDNTLALVFIVATAFAGATPSLSAADKALLDVLLENGVITRSQYERLLEKESLSSADILVPAGDAIPKTMENTVVVEDLGRYGLTPQAEAAIADAVERELSSQSPLEVTHGDKGFRFATRDGDWELNLQSRGQFRYTNPTRSDPRQLDDFQDLENSNLELRRLRIKIGGHGYRPWLKYYFEIDLQPTRDVDDDELDGGARVIDWRIDLARWDWLGLRIGQWKIDYNRERVDSSGRQQFVERSIVNRPFTIDRQVGIQMRGRLFEASPADLRYYAGIYNGEGRGTFNESEDYLLSGRLQWNFLGRDLAMRQTDVEFTEQPAGTLAFATASTRGPCTRWSTAGCGNLDGFTPPRQALDDQYEIDQWMQEFAFKYRGLSIQQEYHRKDVNDRVLSISNELTGYYAQAGYFFHYLWPAVPRPLELAIRYAYVEEPNAENRLFDNERQEYTLAANWFIAGHNNKLTFDYSYLTLDDGLVGRDVSENRIRLQWDVSF